MHIEQSKSERWFRGMCSLLSRRLSKCGYSTFLLSRWLSKCGYCTFLFHLLYYLKLELFAKTVNGWDIDIVIPNHIFHPGNIKKIQQHSLSAVLICCLSTITKTHRVPFDHKEATAIRVTLLTWLTYVL